MKAYLLNVYGYSSENKKLYRSLETGIYKKEFKIVNSNIKQPVNRISVSYKDGLKDRLLKLRINKYLH